MINVRIRSTESIRVAVIALVTLCAASVLSMATPIVNAQASGCTVSANLVNSCRAWLGAAVNSYPQVAADTQSQLEYHEQRIGRSVDIVHTYHATGSNTLSAADVNFATRPQTMLFTDWNPTDTWGNIANQNAAIDQMAASIKALGSTRLFLTLWHEPENDVSPGGDANCPTTKYKGVAGTVADYRNMWRYTSARFTADGVNNVVWAMDYMNYSAFDCLVPDLWPGNNLVDWVMFNAYDNNVTPGSFTSTVDRFGGVLTAAQSSTVDFASKPWGIAEWGSTLTPAQDVAFYDSAKAAVDGNVYPKIKAYVVYDSDGGSVPANQDLRVAYDANHVLDPTKAAHYGAFAGDPALSGTYDPPPLPPDVTAPTVALTSPSDGEQVSAAVTVTGTASDDRGVGSVSLTVDGQDAGVSVAQPGGTFSLTWDCTAVANGTHALALTARDAAGNVARSGAVSVTVANSDTQAPTAPTELTASAAGSGEIDLSWQPATDNVGVDHYVLYRDGTEVTQTDARTTVFVDTAVLPASPYSYRVLAVDAAGNRGNPSNSTTATTPGAVDVSPPSPPGGVGAVAVSGSEIDLGWSASTDNVGVIAYNVYRDGRRAATVSSGTSWADVALSAAATHSYWVTAVDAAGNESSPSATVSATTTDSAPPSGPTRLTATAVGAREVDLAWTAATDNVAVTGYFLYRDGTLLTTLGPVTTYADRSVSEAQSYSYSVDAFDAAGNVGTAASVTTFTPDTTTPSKPTGITATVVGVNRVQVAWSAATDNVGVTGYRLYRDGVLLVMAGAAVTTYTDTTVVDGRSYSYTVSAGDAAGNVSAPSATAIVTTPDATAPTAPAGLTARAVGSTQVALTWSAATDNVGVAGYYLLRNGVRIATLTGTSFTDTGLTNGRTYSYTVTAYDAAGNASAPSLAATATTLDTAAPAMPAKPTVAASAYNKVTVSWTAVTDNVGVVGYRVYRNATLVATVVGATSYLDATVVGATSYSYTVSAYDAAGNASAQSPTNTVTTPAAPDTTAPTVPTGLKSIITITKAVSLSWTASLDNVGVAGYRIYRNGTLLATSAKANYTDGSALQGAKYTYTVASYDAVGNASAQSGSLAVRVPDATAPTAPTGLTLTPGVKTMALRWTAATDNVGVVGYYVWRNGRKLGSVTTGTTYSDKGLVTGTKYSYYVVAYDAAGNLGPASATVTAAAK